LECALERVQDVESGAIALLDENTEIYNQARLTMANIALLQRQLSAAKRGGTIGFVFGGVSFGVGVPLFIEGIRSDNQTMMWSGAGITVGTGLIWAAGHYIFSWW
jgi:Ca2+/H+ antiporter